MKDNFQAVIVPSARGYRVRLPDVRFGESAPGTVFKSEKTIIFSYEDGVRGFKILMPKYYFVTNANQNSVQALFLLENEASGVMRK